MPKFTVTDEIKADGLPVKLACKGVMLQNTGESTVYFGWESTITNGSPAGNDDAEEDAAILAAQGMPLVPGEWRSLSQNQFNLSAPLYFICAAGEETTINFSQNL